jgi:hypothetical protein
VGWSQVGADGGCTFQGSDWWPAGAEVGCQHVEGFDDVGAAGGGGFLVLVLGSLIGDQGQYCGDRES